MNHGSLSPALKGGLLALLAAVLFGLSTPMVQSLGKGVDSFSTAALLYAGAAVVAWVLRKSALNEAGVQKSDWSRLLFMALTGAVIGPVALAWGLQHTSGSSASLMLTLEAVFTALLARRWYGEALDKRVVLALLLLLAGGMVLVIEQGALGQVQLFGLLAVMLATVAWGVDNTLSRGVAERDPGQVVLIKATLGMLCTGTLAFVWNERVPMFSSALGLVAVGATGYGLSLRFYLLAQRTLGAARTGSVFAFAPFIGALCALAMGDRSGSVWMVVAGVFMLLGVVLHLMEAHAHEHTHAVLVHEHSHRHDDGHHDHEHDPMPKAAHSHWHQHAALTHAHVHLPDTQHRHSH